MKKQKTNYASYFHIESNKKNKRIKNGENLKEIGENLLLNKYFRWIHSKKGKINKKLAMPNIFTSRVIRKIKE